MNKIKCLFTAEADDSILKELLTSYDIEYAGWKTEGKVLSESELISRLRDKEVFVTSYDKVTRAVLEAQQHLKLIICTRSNPVNIDIQTAQELGIKVSNTPGRNSDATAEFAVALLLDIARNVTFSNRAIMNHRVIADETPTEKKSDVTWGMVKDVRPYHQFQGVQIKNKNIGIVGYGSIGKRVAKIMEGFGAHLLIYDPFLSRVEVDSPAQKLVDFETLIQQSDFISCHLKITEQTKGMFNREVFKKMKPTAFLINNSRGAIINENDLYQALKNNEIAGAALDVFDDEPLYLQHPFIKEPLDNLLMTPHISGSAFDAITNGTIMLVEEMIRYTQNQPLLYERK